jgi:integrase
VAAKNAGNFAVPTPRDRTLIALMVYSFARVRAALGMKVEDLYTQSRQLWLRLHEKGGKAHKMPCHDNLEKYWTAYIDGCVGRRQSLQWL